MEKEIIDTGLTGKFSTVILRDEDRECIMDAGDYSYFRVHEGMTDREIFDFGLTGVV